MLFAYDMQGARVYYCDVSGDPTQVAAACSANPSCQAFTVSGSSGGLLKSASGATTYTEGNTAYIKA
jgi:hypothetical protein